MRTSDRLRACLSIILLVTGTLVASPSAASSPEEVAANLLYTDGKTAFDAGRYGEALTLFQQAYEVLQNDFIRFYLGRSHAALGQCEQALTHFGALTAKLPKGPREQRRTAEVSCRLHLASGYVSGYRCYQALEVLKPIARQLTAPDDRRQYAALQGTAKQCTDVFGTRTTVGQEAARLYAEARAALRSNNAQKALDLAQQSLTAKRSRPGASVEAIALGTLERCRVAIPRLEEAVAHATADDAHIMRKLAIQCRVSEGERLLKGGSCQAVIDMLDPLKGKLKGEQAVWRKQKVAWCRPRATEFLTDTPTRQAAYKLFLAARDVAKRDKPDAAKRAVVLYQKALKLADMPLIRRELALASVRTQGCAAAATVLAGIPEDQSTHDERSITAACTRYIAPKETAGDALYDHVQGIREVLRLREAGAFPQALAHLKTLATTSTPSLRGLNLDLLYDIGRCDEYSATYKAADPSVQTVATDGTKRLTECRATVAAQAKKVTSESGTPLSTPETSAVLVTTASSDGGGDSTGWITLGTGAALASAGAVFAGLWADAQTRHTDARNLYDTGSGDDALAALNEMERASDDGALYSGLAIGLGAAGVAALTVGIVLMITGSDAPPASTALYPAVGPGHIGLGGSF